ncbi:DUF302 domain-containing protein [Lewinella sp. IMCC34191]|uniref:DUF302 domain-containing protein n=1 Tax=Lewinella sp. IMCC34191 TaxID=2259172 RepID=UPI0018E4F353|nr:DUF302 domain-containing protein [Lewinella sp. IMCC34191]
MTLSRLFCLLVLITSFACQDDDDIEPVQSRFLPEDVPGIYYADEPDGEFDLIYDSLIARVGSSSVTTLAAEIDHAQNAAGVGFTMRPTRLVMMSFPNEDGSLIEVNPLAGLDVPQKMLTYEAEAGTVLMIFNDTKYLADRYGVQDASILSSILNTLGNLPQLSGVTGNVYANNEPTELEEGIITYTAGGSVDSVYTALRGALQSNRAISIITEVDHQANATQVGVELPPNRLIVFGNPNLGTPLLLEAQTIGLDLPQKMVVFESAPGEVTVAYNDPYYLADRHGIDESTPQLSTISDALEGLARGALGL